MKNNYRLLIHRCRTFLFLIFFFTVVVVNIFSVFLNVSFRFSCSCSPTSTSTGSIIIPTTASFTSGWRRCLVFKFSHIKHRVVPVVHFVVEIFLLRCHHVVVDVVINWISSSNYYPTSIVPCHHCHLSSSRTNKKISNQNIPLVLWLAIVLCKFKK